MLDVIERIVWIVAVVSVLLIAAFFSFTGFPSHVPAIAAEARKVDKVDDYKQLIGKVAFEELEKKIAKPVAGATSKTPIPIERRVINRATVERVSNLADAKREADLASSRVVSDPNGGNSLELFDIDESSLLKKVGFQNKDIIDFIDGEKIDFGSTMEAMDLYERLKDEVSTGRAIVVQIRRNGAPLRIAVAPDSKQ